MRPPRSSSQKHLSPASTSGISERRPSRPSLSNLLPHLRKLQSMAFHLGMRRRPRNLLQRRIQTASRLSKSRPVLCGRSAMAPGDRAYMRRMGRTRFPHPSRILQHGQLLKLQSRLLRRTVRRRSQTRHLRNQTALIRTIKKMAARQSPDRNGWLWTMSPQSASKPSFLKCVALSHGVVLVVTEMPLLEAWPTV